jgi:hypothetical protein
MNMFATERLPDPCQLRGSARSCWSASCPCSR